MEKKVNGFKLLESAGIYQGIARGFPTFTKHLPQKLDGFGNWLQTRHCEDLSGSAGRIWGDAC